MRRDRGRGSLWVLLGSRAGREHAGGGGASSAVHRLGVGRVRCEVPWAVVAVIRVAWLYRVGKRFSGRNAAHVEVMEFARPMTGELVLTIVERSSRQVYL